MADYGKYALSAPFARMLEEFVVEMGDTPLITHQPCGTEVVEVEDFATVHTVLQAVVDHSCP